jgi:alcohol dehydrogenase class IV/quinol monooxygenase YgiN
MSSAASGYLAVHVKGKITPGHGDCDKFYQNSLQNARNSVLETGISRFDVLNRIDDVNEFLLIEVYNTATGPDEHKQTAHYNSWRDGVASLMAQPRAATKYSTIFPPLSNWKTDAAASNIDTEAAYMKALPWNYEPFTSLSSSKSAGTSPSASSMLAVVVDVEVTEGSEAAFIEATLANCKCSIKEPGVHRFDFMQNKENPRNFALVEVYNNANAPVEHKATAHYAAWAAAVKDMMARPRSSVKYATKFPKPLYWHRNSFLTYPEETVVAADQQSAAEGSSRGLTNVAGNTFGFLSPKVAMGRGIAAKSIATALKDLNIKKPFIVTGLRGVSRLRDSLFVPSGVTPEEATSYAVGGEPTVEDAQAATAKAIAAGCDGVLCVGGGSAIDLGKAVAALVTNQRDIYDYLEVVGKGKAIENKPLPCIAVPTTSGTGSEVTKNAVLKSTTLGRKASIRHDTMLPDMAIIDPNLTLSCPPQVTAHVGLDALCQVIEPYVSNAANPITDALAKEGIIRAARSLRAVVANGNDVTAREDLSVASVLGGLCLANAKLGAVHGYAAVLGGMFETAPHGAICAALLPVVFRKNAEKLEGLAKQGDATAAEKLARFREVSRLITGLENATVTQGATWLEVLARDLNVPPLSQLCGMQRDQIKEIAAATAVASSTKGNPIPLTTDELEEILEKTL